MSLVPDPRVSQAEFVFHWLAEVDSPIVVYRDEDDDEGLVASFHSAFIRQRDGDHEATRAQLSALLSDLHRDGYLVRVTRPVDHPQPREPRYRHHYYLPDDLSEDFASDNLTPDEASRRWGGGSRGGSRRRK